LDLCLAHHTLLLPLTTANLASEHQDYGKALFALGSFASGAIRGGCFPSLELRSAGAARGGIANEGYAKVTREKHRR